MGSISSRRHSIERPSSRRASMWCGTIACSRVNQKPDRPVSTRPLSGISVGRTTSKVEIRSLATSKRRSSSSSYSSLTLPLPTCVAASGMNRVLLSGELAQPLEDGVDVTCVPAEVEDRVEVDPARDLLVRAHQLAEVLLLLVRPRRMPLDEPVGVAAGEPGLDEREQQPLAEEEAVTGLEVAAHPLRPDVEPFDQPGEPLEHVVQREERIRDDHALRRGVRDVALVPERHVLQPDERVRAYDPGEPADSLGDDRVPLVRHRGRTLLTLAERLGDLG